VRPWSTQFSDCTRMTGSRPGRYVTATSRGCTATEDLREMCLQRPERAVLLTDKSPLEDRQLRLRIRLAPIRGGKISESKFTSIPCLARVCHPGPFWADSRCVIFVSTCERITQGARFQRPHMQGWALSLVSYCFRPCERQHDV